MRRVTKWVRPVLGALLCAGLAACNGSGSSTNKVGGGQDATVLRLANFATA